MNMVLRLVDDLRPDVNSVNTRGQLPNLWGSPLRYVALSYHGGEWVVRLLGHGGDPELLGDT